MSSADETTHLEPAGRTDAGQRTRLEPVDGARSFQRVNLPDPLAERFEVVGDIAGGAEADLLVVRPRDGGETEVVKIYRLRLEPPPEDVRARIAAADPAHVVRMSAPHTWHGVSYQVMEHCAPGSLRSLIDREGPRLAEGFVREALVELHAALRHIHSHEIGLVHRDLKPANVLVRTREPLDLVLGDFGLSEIIGDHSKLFLSAQRTIAYAAPEATHGNINRKSDWWSVGMCVAEMLLGAHPILRHLGSGPNEQVVSQWISDRPVPLEDVPGRWRGLCEGLLTKDVDARWGGSEVGRWLAGEDPEVRRVAAVAAVAPAAAVVAPFGFRALSSDGFEPYDDPRLLAAAFGRHWDEALAIVAGARGTRGDARRLAAFVSDLGLKRAHTILLAGGDDEARLVRLRLALDPDCEPVFRGVDLAGDGLRRLAASAAASLENVATCAALLDARVLSEHAAQPGRRAWASLDAEWLACDQYVGEQFGRLARREGLPALDAPAAAALRVQLLNAIVDPQATARLHAAADSARDDEHARTQEWFAQLADRDATGREALGLDAVVVAARACAIADAALDERRRKARERDRQAQEEYEALGREMTETLSQIPVVDMPRPVRSDPDWIKGLGCLLWVGMTVVAAILAGAGVISGAVLGASPIVLGPLAFALAFVLNSSQTDKAEQEYVARCEQAASRAAERARVETSYAARMNELVPEDR